MEQHGLMQDVDAALTKYPSFEERVARNSIQPKIISNEERTGGTIL